MTRTVNVDYETRCKSAETALARFAKKYPEQADTWGDMMAWMLETGHEFQSDEKLADGTTQPFSWAVHAQNEGDWYYFAVIERE